MKLYILTRKQKLNISIHDAWDFFSNPSNLKKITPPYMGFEIKSVLPEKMYSGMIIEYIIRPLLGIPFKWVTEITHIKENEYFIDEQRIGPYKFWHHFHSFQIIGNKLVMIDKLHYSLPFGFFGKIAHKLFIRSRIEEIFDYRSKMINDLINK